MTHENVADIYKLTPMQQGMLFHSLYSPDSDVYFEQFSWMLPVDVNVRVFERAWHYVVHQHPILRTAFFWEDLDEPLQVVRQQVTLPFTYLDWSHLPADEQEAQLSAYLQADRRQPFDLSRAPLMRVAVMRVGSRTCSIVWSYHHLLLDGWSVPLVLHDVFMAYSALLQRRIPRLHWRRPYRDYLTWLRGQDLKQAARYWHQRLQGFKTPTRLPLDRDPGSTVLPTDQAATAQIVLSAEATEMIQALARHRHLTINTLVQGAWALLLHHYSGEHDLVFGVTVSGRPTDLPDSASIVGCLINTLPIRIRIRSDVTLHDWLHALQRQQAELSRYAYSPLAQIQRWSDVPGGQPLFESIVVFENYPAQVFGQSPHLRVFQRTNYPLTVIAVPQPSLTVRIGYSPHRLDEMTVKRLLEQLRFVLEGMSDQMDRPVTALNLLTLAERERLLVAWNASQQRAPVEQCLHTLFDAQALRTPDAVAVVCADQHLTYGALQARTNQLAWYLQQRGVGPEVLVALCMERSVDLIVAILAILKAGGAYVPIDPAYPDERRRFLFQDARASLLLADGTAMSFPAPPSVTMLDLAQLAPTLDALPTTSPPCRTTPDHLAYVIYTSGSTGQPKGVMIAHRSAVNLVTWATGVYTPAELAGVLFGTSICFDLSIFELFVPLSCGGCAIIAESALQLPDLAAAQQITLINTVPSAAAELVHRRAIPASVRTINLAGEVLPLHLVQQLYEQTPVRQVVNLYGPSETTTYSTWMPIPRAIERAPSIGRPLAQTRVYLLDRTWQLVSIGVIGEISIGGAGVARGYHQRPDLTAAAFIPDSFSATPGSRLYKTGDLARYRPDGTLEFVGRTDQQVKLRGYRIEPGEIEAALVRHPAVREAVVVVREDRTNEQRLIAYVVAGSGIGAGGSGEVAPIPDPRSLIADMRTYLHDRVPAYMVPGAFVVLPALPLTPNGKLDRDALPAPGAIPTPDPPVAPRTPVEQTLAAIWTAVLGLPQVGIHDNFFALGGDSILSLQIVVRARQAAVHLTPRQLFEHPTIADLATVANTTTAVTAEQGLVVGDVPLTPIQRRFFDQQRAPQHWNEAILLSVTQPLAVDTLRDAVVCLLRHHDALRLRYARLDQGWQQMIVDDVSPPLTVLDLCELAADEQQRALQAEVQRAHQSLDLVNGPLLRLVYAQYAPPQRARLLLVIHHLAVDGVSWRVLLDDLQTAYLYLAQGQAVRLPRKTTSFQHWARRLQAYAQTDAIRAERAFWTDPAWAEAAALPRDHDLGPNTVAASEYLSVALSAAETHALLHQVPRTYRTQINDVLLTALAQALTGWTARNTVLIELEGHGRDELFEDVDLSRTVGWLTSFYPVRLQLEPGMEPGPALKTIKEQLRAIPRHGLGYGLLRYLRGDTALAAPPQAELSFNYLGQLDHVLTGDGLFQLAPESPGMPLSPAAHRSHLLDVVARTTGGQLQILWFYSANTHRRETIRGLADSCVSALRALIAHCQQPHVGGYTPSDFPLARLTQHELDQVVGADRQVERVYPLTPLQQGLLFHALYAPQSGAYIVQVGLRFTGTLDVSALQRAWQQVVAHHAILRTAFLWGRVATPHQVVRCQLDVPFTIRDWRAATGDEQQRQLDAWRAADRAAGFDLTSAPLLRVHLFWLDDTTWECVWTHHHLILDGWSLPLVLRDLLTCYAAACEEHPPRLDRPRPYEDYLAWLQEQDQSAAEAYWRTALAGIAAPTPLGIDRPVGVGHTPTYAERTVQMPSATTQALQRLARQEHLTLNTVMQAAWALLLSRYSGSADVVFGTVVAGRPADVPGVEQMVGMFINTLPRRVRLPPTMTLRHWLATLQREQAELRRYEYSALPQVQAWSAIPPGTPLFESLFVFENYPLVGLHAASQALRAVAPLQVEQLPVVQQAHYPLSLLVIPAAQLTLQCSFDQNRVTPAVAQRLLGHLQVVLDALLTDLDQPLAQVPLLTDREREQMLVAWNATQAEYPRHVCMHDVFTAQAEQTPDAPALIAGDGQMTYGELNRRANQLAWYLRARGVSAEARVAICLDRSPEMIVGLLGVLKAGGCYVPLDPAYPAERLHAILQEAQVCVLLTTQRLVARLPSHTAPVVRLDLDWMAIARERSDTLTSGVQPDHLAYVIYTSGSTGQPKGVMIAHRGLCNLATAQIRAFGVTSESRVLQFASLGFDASVSEIWMALLAGATLCLGPRDTPSSGVAALDLLREQAISIATLPPSLLAVLSPADFPALRTVIAAGETCPAHVVERWATPGRCFFNAYGPTEASVCATIAACHASADQPPIGHAIANAQVYVLDKNLQPLPVSVIGEVYIGGVGLARGYDRRVDLTAVTFIPDPFGRTPGARLYRTGDLARLREDGALDFIGRIDRQVKLRGYRIEPGEIEAMLQQHPAVCAAAVVVRGDTLVAYVVGEQRGDGPERASGTREARTVQRGIWHTELQAFLRERLPAYMIPDSVVPLDTLPLTLHGKVDRGHLLARSPERLVLERHVVAPRTEVEETIARIWTSALHLDRVSIHDNFFDLGGSSLLAIHIHTELCQTFNNHISLVEMFRHPTISGLSRYFSQDQAPPESSEHGYEPDQRTRQRIEALNSREKRRKDQV